MESTTLVKVLKTFSASEFREFGKYVNSPFFNQRKRLSKLYDVLKEFYPEFKDKSFTKASIFRKLYPAENFNDKKLRDGFSALLKLAQDFLPYAEFQKNSSLKNRFLLTSLDKRMLDKLFKKKLTDAQNDLKKIPAERIEYFLFQSWFEEIQAEYHIIRNREDLAGNHTIEMLGNEIFRFLAQLIKHFQDMVVNNLNYNIEYLGTLADEFMKCLDVEKFMKYLSAAGNVNFPFLALNYYYLQFLINHESDKSYVNFRKLFDEFIDTFSGKDKYSFYRSMESCLLLKVWLEPGKYNKALFEFYKQIIDKKIYTFYSDKYFDFYLFRNIVIISCSANEIEWTDQFINKYIDNIIPEYKEDLLHLSRAFIEFSSKNYEKVLEEFAHIKLELFHFKMDAKILMLKCYYELNSEETAFSMMDSLKHFLSKNKNLSHNMKNSYFNFINFLNNLMKLKTGSVSLDTLSLKKQILNSKNTFHKQWLLLKLDELQKF